MGEILLLAGVVRSAQESGDHRNNADVVTEAERVRVQEAPAAGHQLGRVDYDAELRPV
jgi:hypothetical protein